VDPTPTPELLETELSVGGGPWTFWVGLIPGNSELLVADMGFDPSEVTIQARIRTTSLCESEWVLSNVIGP
jgi:hypothetical protein